MYACAWSTSKVLPWLTAAPLSSSQVNAYLKEAGVDAIVTGIRAFYGPTAGGFQMLHCCGVITCCWWISPGLSLHLHMYVVFPWLHFVYALHGLPAMVGSLWATTSDVHPTPSRYHLLDHISFCPHGVRHTS